MYLTFIYLFKYFLNFINILFNLFFLDVVNLFYFFL